MTKNPYGDTYVLSHIWSNLWCVELVRARQNGWEIRHLRHAETTSFHRQNRCAPKPFHEYATIKLRVKVVFYVTRLYATTSISRYRLINVAPTIILTCHSSNPWSMLSMPLCILSIVPCPHPSLSPKKTVIVVPPHRIPLTYSFSLRRALTHVMLVDPVDWKVMCAAV